MPGLRTVENSRLVDGLKIDNLPSNTIAELALKADQSSLDDLAGAGRTTETVKDNADDIATLNSTVLLRDGSVELNGGYTPVAEQDISTKKYTDDEILAAIFLTGAADMTKFIYDSNDDGVVNSADKVEGIDGALDDQYYGKQSGTPGFYTITATSIGLGNVDNTSDTDKPISTATQTALDLKANDADVLKLDGSVQLDSGFTPSAPYDLVSKLYVDNAVVASGGFAEWYQDSTDDASITGAVNGVNTVYLLSHAPGDPQSVILSLNGQIMREGATNDYEIVGQQITMTFAPLTGDKLVATYHDNPVGAANAQTRIIDQATAAVGELFRNSDNSNELYYKDNAGDLTKIFDDTLNLFEHSAIPKASLAEAQAGTASNVFMTPERTKQAIDANIAAASETNSNGSGVYDSGLISASGAGTFIFSLTGSDFINYEIELSVNVDDSSVGSSGASRRYIVKGVFGDDRINTFGTYGVGDDFTGTPNYVSLADDPVSNRGFCSTGSFNHSDGAAEITIGDITISGTDVTINYNFTPSGANSRARIAVLSYYVFK